MIGLESPKIFLHHAFNITLLLCVLALQLNLQERNETDEALDSLKPRAQNNTS